MRICSFLPSATEMLYALGLGESVAGVTYECDYPPEARAKPVVVTTRLPRASSAAEIDLRVSEFMSRGESLYEIDLEVLQQIEPDLIITQDLCHVCAASPGDLAASLETLALRPRVLSLNPRKLSDVWNDIRSLGQATGRGAQAEALATHLEGRVAAVEHATQGVKERPRVLCLEWLDPPFIAGHWVPEMVARAGGTDVMGRAGEPGFRSAWGNILESRPDIIVIVPCGYTLDQSVREFRTFQFPAGWNALLPVRNKRVFAADPSSYFSRPGPRLADGTEILAWIFHPDRATVSPPAGSTQSLY